MGIIKEGFYKCKNCAYYQQNHCILRKINVNPEDFCVDHRKDLEYCDNCHNVIVQPLIWTREDGEVKVLCQNCFRRL